jgi:biotin synthase
MRFCVEQARLSRFTSLVSSTYLPTLNDLIAQGPAQAALHEQAAALTQQVFGRRVFVRAVVEVSNFCRENCHYCAMRRDNRALTRFRATPDQLAEWILSHCPPSARDLNIQGGEDPVAVREVVLPLLRLLRQETQLGLSVCCGTLTETLYREMREAGARYYILKFETSNRPLYAALQAPGTLPERLHHIRLLAASGWRVSSGFIAGLPRQTRAHLLRDLETARSLPLAGCSVSPFIPGESTPLSEDSAGDVSMTLNCMAMLRLMRPEWLIPAVSALCLNGCKDGYRRGLGAGANLVTINLTPSPERGRYLLYKNHRVIMTEERVLSEIERAKLAPAQESLLDCLAQPATI